MTGPMGNSEFCFPSTSMFPSASPRGTLRVSGIQNSLFLSGPVIKCLLTCISGHKWSHVSQFNFHKSWFISKSFVGPFPILTNTKQQLDVIYYLYKMKQTDWLLSVAKNWDWFRKITPLPNLNRASHGVKAYSESRIEPQILQCRKNQVSHQSNPVS